MGNIESFPQTYNCTCPTAEPLATSEAFTFAPNLHWQLSTLFVDEETSVPKSSEQTLTFPGLVEVAAQPGRTGIQTWKTSDFAYLPHSLHATVEQETLIPRTVFPRFTTAEFCTCTTYPTNPDQSWIMHQKITGVLSVLVCLLIVVANLFVIGNITWSLCRHFARRKVIHSKRSYIFMLNLAFADLFVGVATIVSFGVKQTDGTVDEMYESCLIEICFVITPCCASVFAMTIVSVDKYLAVMQPFKYKQVITIKKAVITVAIQWLVACLIGFAPLMGWGVVQAEYLSNGRICSYLYIVRPSYVIFTFFGGFMPQLALIIYLYVQIFKVSKKHDSLISQPHFNTSHRSSAAEPSIVVNHFLTSVAPMAVHSCPVTPSMNDGTFDTPPKRKPYRTVSFGPASFEDENLGSINSAMTEDEEVEIEMAIQDRMREIVGEVVFDHNLDLPGTAHTQPLHRKSLFNTDPSSTPRNSIAKGLSVGRLKRTVSYAGSAALTSITQISQHFSNLKHDVRRKNIKALRTISIVIGFFFLMWTPFLIVSAIQKLCGRSCKLENLVGTYLLFIGICNSAINPLVYTYTNKELKRQMRSCCKKTKNQVITDHQPVVFHVHSDY